MKWAVRDIKILFPSFLPSFLSSFLPSMSRPEQKYTLWNYVCVSRGLFQTVKISKCVTVYIFSTFATLLYLSN